MLLEHKSFVYARAIVERGNAKVKIFVFCCNLSYKLRKKQVEGIVVAPFVSRRDVLNMYELG